MNCIVRADFPTPSAPTITILCTSAVRDDLCSLALFFSIALAVNDIARVAVDDEKIQIKIVVYRLILIITRLYVFSSVNKYFCTKIMNRHLLCVHW